MRRVVGVVGAWVVVVAAVFPAVARAESRPEVGEPSVVDARVVPVPDVGVLGQVPTLDCAPCAGGADGMPVAAVKSQPRLEGLVLGGFAASTTLGLLAGLWAAFGTVVNQPLLFNIGFTALVLSAVQFAATFAASFIDAARGPQPGAWGDEGRRRLQSMWPLAIVFPGLAHLLAGRTAHGLWVLDLFGAGLAVAALSPVLLAAGGAAVGVMLLVGFGLSATVWVASFLDAATAGGILNFLPNFEGSGGGADGLARVDVAAAIEVQRRGARPVGAW